MKSTTSTSRKRTSLDIPRQKKIKLETKITICPVITNNHTSLDGLQLQPFKRDTVLSVMSVLQRYVSDTQQLFIISETPGSGKTQIVAALIKIYFNDQQVIIRSHNITQWKEELDRFNIRYRVNDSSGDCKVLLSLHNTQASDSKWDLSITDDIHTLTTPTQITFQETLWKKSKQSICLTGYLHKVKSKLFDSIDKIYRIQHFQDRPMPVYVKSLSLRHNAQLRSSLKPYDAQLIHGLPPNAIQRIEFGIQHPCNICTNGTINPCLTPCCWNIVCSSCGSLLINCPYCTHPLLYNESMDQFRTRSLVNFPMSNTDKILFITEKYIDLGNIAAHWFQAKPSIFKLTTDKIVTSFRDSPHGGVGYLKDDPKFLIGWNLSFIDKVVCVGDINKCNEFFQFNMSLVMRNRTKPLLNIMIE